LFTQGGVFKYKACRPVVPCFYDSRLADQVMSGRISKTKVDAKHERQGIGTKWSWKMLLHYEIFFSNTHTHTHTHTHHKRPISNL